MRVSLYIPYWGDEPTRQEALFKVMAMMMPQYAWYTAAPVGATVRHRGKARNLAIRQALDHDVDVAVILDADSFTESAPLSLAISTAFFEGGINFPHNRVRAYNQDGSYFEYGPSAGGCWVARPDQWVEAGRMEERGGWSVDDRTFLCQMATLGLGPVYHDGVLTCLWHNRDPGIGPPGVPPEDKALIQPYLDAMGKPQEMRRLIENRPYSWT